MKGLISLKTIKDLLHQLHPDFDYDKSDDFISDGLIDSIDMQELFALIEEEYNVELAKATIHDVGFNEIQFDYVRFPEDAYNMSKSG